MSQPIRRQRRRTTRRALAVGAVASGAVLGFGALPASAAPGVTTVTWAPDGSVDGAGTGTLGGTTIAYTTAVGGNAGLTLGFNWNTSLATNGAVGAGASSLTAGVLGVNGPGSQTNTITFSAPVVNPTIYVTFTDSGTSLNFGTLPVTLLDSNNASLTGSVVSFAGSGNSANDGFAGVVTGTFGPGSPLTFSYVTTNSLDTATFTLAFPQPTVGNDTPTTAANTPVTFNPLTNDSANGTATLTPSSVRLVGAGGSLVTTLTNVDGTYTVNTTTGAITFTPAVGFIGTAAPVTYSVADSNGASATATITSTVTNNSAALPDNVTVSSSTPTTFNPLANDVPPGGGTLDVSSVRLLDSGGNPTTSLSNADGTYTVNTTTGQITFTPSVTFTGPSTVTYRVTDSFGTTRTATITVAVPVVGIPLVAGLAGGLALALVATGGLTFLLHQRRTRSVR